MDNSAKKIVLGTGADIWSIVFIDSPKGNDEFTEQLFLAINSIWKESINAACKRVLIYKNLRRRTKLGNPVIINNKKKFRCYNVSLKVY